MFNLNTVNNGFQNEIELPQELKDIILFNLSSRDLQAMAEVSHSWNLATINTAKKIIYSNIINFSRYCGLEQPVRSKSDHTTFLQDRVFVNLTQLNLIKFELNEEIANFLKDRKDHELKNLENQFKSKLAHPIELKCIENICKRARIYKKQEKIDQSDGQIACEFTLLQISRHWTEMGIIDQALAAANSIKEKNRKVQAFLVIFDSVTKIDEIETDVFDKLLEEVKRTFDKQAIGTVFLKVAKMLMERGFIDKSIEVASKIPEETTRDSILAELCQYLIVSGKEENVYLSIKVSKMISDPIICEPILLQILSPLINSGDFQAALEVTDRLEEEAKHAAHLIVSDGAES
jgi:hypothetical protein